MVTVSSNLVCRGLIAAPSQLDCDVDPELEPELSDSDERTRAGGMAAPDDMIRVSMPRPGGKAGA